MDKLNLQMFKLYDIRTVAKDLDESNRYRLFRAIAKYYIEVVKVNSIVLARDSRLDAPLFMQCAIDLFPLYGLNVIVNPLQISTCQFYFTCMQNRNSGGLMFTASHNPGEYIGIKLLAANMETIAMNCGPKGGLTTIKRFYEEDASLAISNMRGTVLIKRYYDQYLDYSLNLAGVSKNSLKGNKILLDFLSGTAGSEISEALNYAGASINTRNIVPDGYFLKGPPNPIIQTSVQETWNIMKSGEYDYGFCYDGDGDRMDVLHSCGKQISPSFNMSILLKPLTKIFGSKNKLNNYYDSKSNPLAVIEMAKNDVDVHIIRNGHSFIKESLNSNKKHHYIGASEESAHYYLNFPYNIDNFSEGFASTENTLFFTLLTAKMWGENPKEYDKIMQLQNSIFREREWSVNFQNPKLMNKTLDQIKLSFINNGLTNLTTMENGNSLDACLLRKGIPNKITKDTKLESNWIQVAQRISRSEDLIARWEIIGNNEEIVCQSKKQIDDILLKALLENEGEIKI